MAHGPHTTLTMVGLVMARTIVGLAGTTLVVGTTLALLLVAGTALTRLLVTGTALALLLVAGTALALLLVTGTALTMLLVTGIALALLLVAGTALAIVIPVAGKPLVYLLVGQYAHVSAYNAMSFYLYFSPSFSKIHL